MSTFFEQVDPLKQAALAEMAAAQDLAALELARTNFLGMHGKFTALMKQLGALSKEERPAAGKQSIKPKPSWKKPWPIGGRSWNSRLHCRLSRQTLPRPGRRRLLGKLHPLTQVTEDIVRIFRKIGFVVADGPEIEDEYHCFDALNTPADHPARDSQDTFYLDRPTGSLLRTHTSSVQIRVMEKQTAARADHRPGPGLSARQCGRDP